MNRVAQWLGAQLKGLVSVRGCVAGHDMVASPIRPADLIVHTWSGVQVHIHMLEEALNPRTLKRIVENATKNGIPVLFMVDMAALPAHEERFEIDKWFLPLHNLMADRIYGYRISDEGPEITRIIFERAGRTDTYITRHEGAVIIQKLRYYRHSVSHKAVKGFWMVADFGEESPTTKRRANQNHNGRTQYNPPPNPQYQRAQQPPPKADSPPASPPPPRQLTQLERCYDLFGLKQTATRQEVKTAFRRFAFELHPDTSRLPKDEAEARFKAISEAYEYIKSANKWT